MASETQVWPPPHATREPWPPDDTEESVVGTNLHQTTIVNLRVGINEAAALQRIADEPAPWYALDQIVLIGCRRRDGSAYRTMPDVFVYRHEIDPTRGSLAIALDGAPVLIIEVLSESTYASDIDLIEGKGYSYARAGVREYLALDPTGSFVRDGGCGWRLEDGAYVPWERDADGRWQSAEIAVAIGLEGTLATVYTHDGRRIRREGEFERELARHEETLARQADEIAELRRRLREAGDDR